MPDELKQLLEARSKLDLQRALLNEKIALCRKKRELNNPGIKKLLKANKDLRSRNEILEKKTAGLLTLLGEKTTEVAAALKIPLVTVERYLRYQKRFFELELNQPYPKEWTFGLSQRTINVLKNAGIDSKDGVKTLLSQGDNELLKYRNAGRGTLLELKQWCLASD